MTAGTGDATGDEHHAFWADEIAAEIDARDPEDPVVIKGAVSPSGVPHVGHFNEVLLGYFVAEVLRERGHAVRQVFTSDDRDPLRRLPRTLADAEGRLVELGDVDAGALGRNLGVPYADIPDPFEDGHGSYGEHFTALFRDGADRVDVPVEVISTAGLYEAGDLDGVVREILAAREQAASLLAEYQDTVDEDYVPFMAKCADCGKLTTGITAVDLDAGTVEYECTDLEAGNQVIEGCGHRGTATFREGKLPWRFEWPALWKVLGVDFEPFGKDHAEGSWPSGQRIASELLGVEPPVPMVYEWFTLDGEALSSSSGNVITVTELLEFMEPAVLRYFFARTPRKQRDLDLERADLLVDAFDRFEAVYFGEVAASDDERRLADRVYPFLVDEVRPERVRLPYTFAAVLGMTDDRDLRVRMARGQGHIDEDTPDWAVDAAMDRVERARRWARRMDNEYNYRLQADVPAVSFAREIEAALEEVAAVVDDGADGDEIQAEIYEAAARHDVDAGEVFAAGYELFFGQPQGPRLGPFLAALDRSFVVRRLRREA